MCCKVHRSDMFLKTLLLMALCFQAFSVRIFDKIHGGLEMGKALNVEVSDPELHPEFVIRLFSYNTLARDVSDIGLRVNVSTIGREISMNSMVNGIWQGYSRFVWEKPKDPHSMSLQIVMEKSYFNVIIFDKQSYPRNYRLPAESLNYWEIEYRQDYQVASAIWFRKFVPCGTCSSSYRDK